MSVEMDVDSGDALPQADAGPAAEEVAVTMSKPDVPVPIKSEPEQTPIQPEPPKQKPGPHYKIRYSLSGHTMSISSLKFSPDGSKLASSGADKIIKLWDTYTGDVLRTLVGHTEGISDIAWSNDGEYLASASDDKTIRIWDMKVGTEIKTLLGHTNFVFCVNYNPNSNLLVSGGFDETVRVWDVARAHSDPVTSVAFNHDGTLIVSCAMDGLMSLRIWDADSGQCLKTLVDDDNPICSHVKFTPNSKFVLASTQDSTLRLWNYQTSRCVKTYTGHTNRTFCIFACFTNTKGKYVVSGSEDAKVYIWDLQTRQILQVLQGHRDVVLALATHPTKSIIASASMEKDLTIRLWYDDSEDPIST
ncbi:WD40 repeat-containing protein [Mycena venus]|uniref:WD40 repeat-containing protein n=1 Tax=Mycena venus TaxID=2733690 RepID=A0A8H6XGA7_9AGAR|nr:WD40 repeat-containing protein [Mycena venus]